MGQGVLSISRGAHGPVLLLDPGSQAIGAYTALFPATTGEPGPGLQWATLNLQIEVKAGAGSLTYSVQVGLDPGDADSRWFEVASGAGVVLAVPENKVVTMRYPYLRFVYSIAGAAASPRIRALGAVI